MRVIPVLLALALVTSACGSDPRLTVAGHARLDVGGTPTGFQFPTDIRLDGPGTAADVTGSCVITRFPDRLEVVAELHRQSAGDLGLRRFVVRGSASSASGTDDFAAIAAAVGARALESTTDCVAITAIYPQSGSLSLRATDCMLRDTGPVEGAPVLADVSLDWNGCGVYDAAR